jgi:hypothetical protein
MNSKSSRAQSPATPATSILGYTHASWIAIDCMVLAGDAGDAVYTSEELS